MTHYAVVKNYESALKARETLTSKGIPESKISVLVKVKSNEQPADMSKDTLVDKQSGIDNAPAGTVSAYGATFSVLTGVTSGILLAGIGPVAAAVGAAAVAATGTAMVLSGIGIPEEKHNEIDDLLSGGKVLVVTDTGYEDAAAEVLSTIPRA